MPTFDRENDHRGATLESHAPITAAARHPPGERVAAGVFVNAVRPLEEAPFLSREHKRDILYNNEARFLRLSDEKIARHHGM